MTTLEKILIYYGMPESNIQTAIEQIAETYGANRYLEGVMAGVDAVDELREKEEKGE